jgi:uncharacterized protein with GYD domain
LKKTAERVASEIKKQCPGVIWKESYATMGRFDVVDIVEADDPAMVEKAAMIIGGVRSLHNRNHACHPLENVPGIALG